MICSNRHKFIFVHVPKTGGTSIRSVLGSLDRKDAMTIKLPFLTKKKMLLNEHLTALEIKNIVLPSVWDTTFKFAFVRNPWSVMLSHYLYFKTNPGGSVLAKKAKSLSFNQYIDWYFNFDGLHRFKNGFSDFLRISGKDALDFIGKQEFMDKDFSKVCDLLNIAKIKLPRKNVTKHKHYRVYYDSNSIKIVKRAFERDNYVFQYTF